MLKDRLVTFSNQPSVITESYLRRNRYTFYYGDLYSRYVDVLLHAPLDYIYVRSISDTPFVPDIIAYILAGQGLKALVNTVDTLKSNIQVEYEDRIKELNPRNEASILLASSGTSGKQKLILHNLNKFLLKYENSGKPLTTILIYNPLSMGGLDVILSTFSNGGTIVVPALNSVPWVLESIQTNKVELLPASPSFLRLMLLSGEVDNFDLSSLKIITYGSEKMDLFTLNRLKQKFPDVKFKQTFGMSETGTLHTKSGEDLWIQLDNVNTRVVDGILQIKSDTSMLGYLNYPSPYTEDGWLITGDRVEINGDFYRFLGRDSTIINVGGNKVFPEKVEELLLKFDPEVFKDVLVYGEENSLLGEIVVADVVLNDKNFDNLSTKFKNYCIKNLEKFEIPVKWNYVDNLVYTESGKKRRNK